MPPLPPLPPLPPRCDADALGRSAAHALLAPQLAAAALVADGRRAYPRNSSPEWIRANAQLAAASRLMLVAALVALDDAFADAFADAFVEAYFGALGALDGGEVTP